MVSIDGNDNVQHDNVHAGGANVNITPPQIPQGERRATQPIMNCFIIGVIVFFIQLTTVAFLYQAQAMNRQAIVTEIVTEIKNEQKSIQKEMLEEWDDLEGNRKEALGRIIGKLEKILP